LAKKPPPTEDVAPDGQAEVTPRDLYPTSDIRFVLVEIGKLSTKTDRLVEDVKSHSGKIDRLRMTIAAVGGGAAVLIFILGIAARVIPLPHISFDPPAAAESTAKR
jgi:hypothetical protein